MQFEDKSDDKQVLLSPTKKTSSTTETLKIIVSDVVVDLSQAAKSSSSTSSSFQMMYVDLKWRNKSLRTVASAKKLENTASKTSSSTSSSSNNNNNKQSSTFSGERTEFVVKSSSSSPQEDGTDDVMIVTLRRCEVFGDSDLSCVAFRLSDVPWIKRSPIVVIAGPFMLSLQAETFGYELPPELTLAERIDAVGGPVEVVVGTGDRARAKQVPTPPSDESLKRKAVLNSDKGLDGPTRRKNRDESDPLGDGTAEAVDRRRQKQNELAELRRREEEEKNGKKNEEEVRNKKEEDEGAQNNDEHGDDDNNKQNRLPLEVQQVIDCQIPPEPPVLATLGIDLEIAPCSNNDKDSSGDRFRDPGLLHNAINSAAPALAAAAKHDINEKLRRDFDGENSTTSCTPSSSASFNQQQPSSYFNVDLSSINTVVNNNCGNNYHNNNNDSNSSSPMTIVLNVEVKPNERTHLLDPELMEKIRKVLEKESSGSDDGKHALWKSSDFPNVARCIMHNVSDSNNNNSEEQSQQERKEKSSSSVEVQADETSDNFFSKVECTNCEVAPSLSSSQLAEQQRIINSLERRPLEIIANHNLTDPSTPLRWRGTLPDERCPLVPVVYKRDKYTVNALISVNLLPILANGKGNKNNNSSSSSTSPSRGFFSALSDKISGAVEKVSSSIDSDRLLSDFPELRSQMWSNGQATENQKIPVAAVFDCQALNGFGTPLSGKLYMTASEMFFQTSSSVLDSSSSSNNKNPASKIHWRACFANEIVCVRRIVAFGSEAFQVFTRSGTVMQFQEFDGFFARAGLAIGLRTFTKFFAAWMIVLDLWHAWRAPVQSELKK